MSPESDGKTASLREGATDGTAREIPGDSDLARLLDAESGMEESLAEARRRAADTLRAARDRARSLRRDAAARLEEDLAEMRDRVREEHRAALEEIRRRAGRRARRYRETAGDTVDELARAAVRRLVEDAP